MTSKAVFTMQKTLPARAKYHHDLVILAVFGRKSKFRCVFYSSTKLNAVVGGVMEAISVPLDERASPRTHQRQSYRHHLQLQARQS